MKELKATHTPGPWEVSSPIDGTAFTVWVKDHAEFDGPLVIATGLIKSNADLVAAAPKLLVHMKKFEAILDRLYNEEPVDLTTLRMGRIIATALIKEAEGK